MELLRSALLCEVSPQLIRGGPECGHHSWETVSCPALGPQHGLRPRGRVAGRADMPQRALPSGATEGSVPLDCLLTRRHTHIFFSIDLPICPWGCFLFRWFGAHLGFSVISSWVTNEVEGFSQRGISTCFSWVGICSSKLLGCVLSSASDVLCYPVPWCQEGWVCPERLLLRLGGSHRIPPPRLLQTGQQGWLVQ